MNSDRILLYVIFLELVQEHQPHLLHAILRWKSVAGDRPEIRALESQVAYGKGKRRHEKQFEEPDKQKFSVNH